MNHLCPLQVIAQIVHIGIFSYTKEGAFHYSDVFELVETTYAILVLITQSQKFSHNLWRLFYFIVGGGALLN